MAVARREDDEDGVRLRRACEQLEREREEGEREVWNLRSRWIRREGGREGRRDESGTGSGARRYIEGASFTA
jgi:hypothetical protein